MHPQLLSPVLCIIHRAINTFLIKQTNVKRIDTTTGAEQLCRYIGFYEG